MRGATCQHTAHQLGRTRIFYRFHPYFEREVDVVRALRREGEPCFIVRLDGDTGDRDLSIAVPGWMLDPVACQDLAIQPTARLDIDSLLRLRQLVDLHSRTQIEDAGSCSKNPPGGNDGPEPDHSAETSAGI
jgi:hypothetical protein